MNRTPMRDKILELLNSSGDSSFKELYRPENLYVQFTGNERQFLHVCYPRKLANSPHTYDRSRAFISHFAKWGGGYICVRCKKNMGPESRTAILHKLATLEGVSNGS